MKNLKKFGVTFSIGHLTTGEIFKLIEEFEGTELIQHKEYYTACDGDVHFPVFQLNDGRIFRPFDYPSPERISKKHA